MASEKTLYWVSVALLAVFVGNHFASKYQNSCLGTHALATVQHLEADATNLTAMTRMAFAENPNFAGPELHMARVESRFAAVEASMARQQAACARTQAQRARMLAREQMQRIEIIGPRERLTLEISPISAVVRDGIF
jgi:hypothetical protein